MSMLSLRCTGFTAAAGARGAATAACARALSGAAGRGVAGVLGLEGGAAALLRVYVAQPLLGRSEIVFDGAATAHILARRLAPGDGVVLFTDADGERGRGEHLALLTAVSRKCTHGKIHLFSPAAELPFDAESRLFVHLVQALCPASTLDLIFRQCSEGGVRRFSPVVTARSVAQPRTAAAAARRKLDHWRLVAIAACEQSGRTRVPLVDEPVSLTRWLRALREDSEVGQPGEAGGGSTSSSGGGGGAVRLLLDPDARAVRLEDVVRDLAGDAAAPRACTIFVGPEGGLEEHETRELRAAGFLPVRLGPRILRVDTAAAAAVALVQSLYGDI